MGSQEHFQDKKHHNIIACSEVNKYGYVKNMFGLINK